jgi:hypothetical protein
MTDPDLIALRAQIAHLEDLLREFEDQNGARVHSLHARLGDLEDLILGQQRAQASFTGHAQGRMLGRVPLTLVRDDEPA